MAFSAPIPTIPDLLEDERPRALILSVGATRYALPVERVREVVRTHVITPIPGAPPVACGLVNVRGQVVTVLDLAVLVAPDDPAARSSRALVRPWIVLLEHGGRPVGVAVDAVHDVRPFGEAPDLADETPRPVCGDTGVGDAALTHLDLEALLARVMLSSEEGP